MNRKLEGILLNYYTPNTTQDYDTYVWSLIPVLNRLDNNRYTHTTNVRTATIQVTEDCNLRCSYCYQINKSHNRMKFDTAKKFIDLLLSDDKSINSYLNRENTDFIILDFIGGEPLLEIDLIDKIVDYFIKRCIELNHPWVRGYMISIGNNGTLYFDPRVQNFLKKHPNRISLNITVDGNKLLHDSCRIFPDGSGSYDLASAAAKDWLKRKGMSGRSTKLTIAPENVMYLKDAILNMIDLGFNYINENCVYEDVWNDPKYPKILYSQLKEIADYLLENDLEGKINLRILDPRSYSPQDIFENRNWCGGDGSMIAVDVDGGLYNCIRYMKSSLGNDRAPLIIGTVDEGIGTTEEYRNNINCMKCITRRSQSTDQCYFCPINKGCGYCSAYNYQLYGTPNKRTTTTCEMHKASSLASAYYWNKVLIKHNEPVRVPVYCPEEWAVPIIGQEEYDMIIELSGHNKIHEKEWYNKTVKPILITDDKKIIINPGV